MAYPVLVWFSLLLHGPLPKLQNNSPHDPSHPQPSIEFSVLQEAIFSKQYAADSWCLLNRQHMPKEPKAWLKHKHYLNLCLIRVLTFLCIVLSLCRPRVLL